VGLCEEAGWMRGKEVKDVKDNRGGKFVWANFGEALGRMLHTKIQVPENSEHNRCPPPTTSHPPPPARAEDMRQQGKKEKCWYSTHCRTRVRYCTRATGHQKETKSPPPKPDRFLGHERMPNKITAATAYCTSSSSPFTHG